MISDLHIRYETLSVKFNEPPKTFGRCQKRILSLVICHFVCGKIENMLRRKKHLGNI